MIVARGMVFPPSYFRPQYTDAEELEHEAQQAREDAQAPGNGWAGRADLPKAEGDR